MHLDSVKTLTVLCEANGEPKQSTLLLKESLSDEFKELSKWNSEDKIQERQTDDTVTQHSTAKNNTVD